MAKKWCSIGPILISVLACGILLVTGQAGVQADSFLRPNDNVTGTDNSTGFRAVTQSDGCNNINTGGILETTNQYILIDVDCWHAGHCALCDEYADYSCWGVQDWCWFSPCSFNDPLPNGQIVTRIEADVRLGSCGNTLTRVYINDTLIGAGSQSGNCLCGTCNPVFVSSETYPSGFPRYIYDGLNNLGLQVDGEGCVSDVHVKIYYKKALISTTPHGTGGYGIDALLPAQPLNPSNIVVQGATIDTEKASPGEQVNVTATVANKGGSNGTTRITMYVNGVEESSQGLTINSGSTTPVNFTVSRNEPGTYHVYINGVSAGSFAVDTFTGNDILIYGTIALFTIGIAVTLYFLVRRRAV